MAFRTTINLNDEDAGFVVNNTTSETLTGTNADHRILSIGTSEEEITIDTDIGSVGYMYLKNKDSTNFVEVGFLTTQTYGRLLAGQACVFPLTPAHLSIFLKANSASCDVEVLFREA